MNFNNHSVTNSNDVRSITDTDANTSTNNMTQAQTLRTPKPIKERPAKKHRYPIESFPAPLQTVIAQGRDCLGFPMDYLGTSMLYTASVLTGTTHKVQVFEGFETCSQCFFVLMGKKSVTKSHPLTRMIKPIQDIDKMLYNAYKKQQKDYDAYMELDAKEKKETDPVPIPVLRKTQATDFTVESLQRVLSNVPRGMGIYVDELIALVRGFDRYGKGGIGEQLLMSLFNGIPIDIVRGAGLLRVNLPFVSVIGTMQPEVLHEFAKGRVHNGFLDRFLFAYPVDAKKIKWSELGIINKECLVDYDRICNAIYQMPLELDEHGDPVPKMTPFSSDAKKILYAWHDLLTDDIRSGEGDEAGKIDSIIPRIALILQVLHDVCDGKETIQIEVGTVQKAIDLMTYYRDCAKQVYAEITGGGDGVEGEFYEKLSDAFEWKEAVKIGLDMGLSERTIARHVGNELKYAKIRKGFYKKKHS